MKINAKIFVAGSNGLVGTALIRRMKVGDYHNLQTPERDELDLTDYQAVAAFSSAEKPGYVILAAAKAGGIHADNTYPAEFIYLNRWATVPELLSDDQVHDHTKAFFSTHGPSDYDSL